MKLSQTVKIEQRWHWSDCASRAVWSLPSLFSGLVSHVSNAYIWLFLVDSNPVHAGLILSLYSAFHGSLCSWPGDYRVCRPTSLFKTSGRRIYKYTQLHGSRANELKRWFDQRLKSDNYNIIGWIYYLRHKLGLLRIICKSRQMCSYLVYCVKWRFHINSAGFSNV